MNKKLAVVILNWNGKEMMRRFLPSVVEYSSPYDVIVADNGSTDGSVEMLHDEFPTVQTIVLDQNYGFAEGYNRALQQVQADYFLLLNSDVEVTPHWLTPLVQYMDLHDDVAACQPKLLAQRDKSKFEYAGAAGGFIDAYGYPYCRGRVFGSVEKDEGQYDEQLSVFWATGAALMVRSSDWAAVGGFDSRFFAHMEEIDFCWRLRSRGRRIVCLPDSIVYHVGGATLNAGSPRKTYLNFRNNLLMLYKNVPADRLSSVLRRRCFLDYVAACKLLLTDGWQHFSAVYKARRDFKRLKAEYKLKRAEVQKEVRLKEIPEMYEGSLLWSYYVKGRKTWSQMKE